MALRKGKLKRPCNDCGEYFEPTGKACKLCEKCFENRRKRK